MFYVNVPICFSILSLSPPPCANPHLNSLLYFACEGLWYGTFFELQHDKRWHKTLKIANVYSIYMGVANSQIENSETKFNKLWIANFLCCLSPKSVFAPWSRFSNLPMVYPFLLMLLTVVRLLSLFRRLEGGGSAGTFNHFLPLFYCSTNLNTCSMLFK